MKSEKGKKGAKVIRAVIATAFALVVCLPTSAAFAAELIDGGQQESPAPETQQLADNAVPIETDGSSTPMVEAALSATSESVSSDATESNGLKENLSGDLRDDPSSNAIEDASSNAAADATPLETADIHAATQYADGVASPEWLEAYGVEGTGWVKDAGSRTITLKARSYSGDATTTVYGKTRFADGVYTTVVENRFDSAESCWASPFSDVWDFMESIDFKDGVLIHDATNLFDQFSVSQVDVSGLDVSACTSMQGMFSMCRNLAAIDVSGWNTSSCTNMERMFSECEKLAAIDVSRWNTSACTNMKEMFSECEKLAAIDVSRWNTSSCTNMERMFFNCGALESLDVSKWDVSNVTNMSAMFEYCRKLTNLDVSTWKPANLTDMSFMFHSCESLSSSFDVSGWADSVSKVERLQCAFMNIPSSVVFDLSKWVLTSVNDPVWPEGGDFEDDGGWNSAFRFGPSVAGNGKIGTKRSPVASEGETLYIGFDISGNYGMLLEDSMDRVFCLNHERVPPLGNLYTKEYETCDSAGLNALRSVVSKGELDDQAYAEMWHKIVAAIVFYGNVRDAMTQRALQGLIWHYSDGARIEGFEEEAGSEPGDTFYDYYDFDIKEGDYDQMSALAVAMRDYVESNYTNIDFDSIVINYYAPKESQYQNLLSLRTAETTRHVEAGELKVSKEVAAGSNADTTQEFTFKVTLTFKEDGSDEYKPYVRNVQVKNEGDAEYRLVAPSANGEITLTTIGAGEAWIADLAEGVSYIISEMNVAGWTLLGKTGETGTIVKRITSNAVFTNGETETSATVKKIWDDEDNKYQKRPATISVTLSNGTTVTLSAENGWTATVEHLPRYVDGKAIVYTWSEGEMPEGYRLSNTLIDGTVTTLTNSHEYEKAKGKEETHEEAKAEKAQVAKAVGAARGMVRTGDDMLLLPLAALFIISLVTLVVIRRRQDRC